MKELTDKQKVQLFDELVDGAERIVSGKQEDLSDFPEDVQKILVVSTTYFLGTVNARIKQLGM
jgi:hypothetical protein